RAVLVADVPEGAMLDDPLHPRRLEPDQRIGAIVHRRPDGVEERDGPGDVLDDVTGAYQVCLHLHTRGRKALSKERQVRRGPVAAPRVARSEPDAGSRPGPTQPGEKVPPPASDLEHRLAADLVPLDELADQRVEVVTERGGVALAGIVLGRV